MNLEELQNKMLRTASFDEPFDRAVSLCALGLVGEAGEIADLVKKIFYHHHDFDAAKRAKLIEEGGDFLWYVFYFCRMTGLSFESILRHERYQILVARQLETDDSKTYTFLAAEIGYKAGIVAGAIINSKKTLEIFDEIVLGWFREMLTEPVAYLHQLAERLGSSLEEMCEVVIGKLDKRYPNGFNPADSIARRDTLSPLVVGAADEHAKV